MKKTKKVIRARFDARSAIATALDYAAERACNRSDKYNEMALTESQRETLIREFSESFWLALDDAEAEIR